MHMKLQFKFLPRIQNFSFYEKELFPILYYSLK